MRRVPYIILVIFIASCHVSGNTNNTVQAPIENKEIPQIIKKPRLKQKLPKDFNIAKFKKMNPDEQVAFINSMDRDAKMEFLNLFLPGSAFFDANADVRFYGNGEFIEDDVLYGQGWYIGKWKIQNHKLVLNKNNEKLGLIVKEKEIWGDVIAEKFQNVSFGLCFFFEPGNEKSDNHAGSLLYEKFPDTFRRKEITEYLKKKVWSKTRT